MKFRHEVSAEKLRGGFYTPPSLARECLSRAAELIREIQSPEILEPSVGDGAFIRAVSELQHAGKLSDASLTGLELFPDAAANSAACLSDCQVSGEVINASFLEWASSTPRKFDAIVGNPPFVRYQFVASNDRRHAEEVLAKTGLATDGVSNLWIPFLLCSLSLLREGGSFSFVLPSELLAIKSAGLVRSELVRHFTNLKVDLYPPGTFDGILQGIVVLSGRKGSSVKSCQQVAFRDLGCQSSKPWNHLVDDSKLSWKRYLLSPPELRAYREAIGLPNIVELGSVAEIGVSIVTGANDFFTISDETAETCGLKQWTVPLLARTSESPGLCFRASDHAKAIRDGHRCWLLNFSPEHPAPMRYAGARKYVKAGEERKLHERYKCRIRSPWYTVPDVRPGSIMLTKRAHQFHRLLANKCEAVTTDTVYRGYMKPLFKSRRDDLIAGFHNSLTIISTEIEGRNYGGGVLELIPSEISRLAVPLLPVKSHLRHLDRVCRSSGGQRDSSDTLIDETDKVLREHSPEFGELLASLRASRIRLRKRRFEGC